MKQRIINSSGLLTADTAVLAGPGVFMGAILIHDGTANAGSLTVYDDADSADGTVVGQINIGASPAAGALTQGIWFGPDGVSCANGIYADETTAGVTGFLVFYS